MRNQDIFRAALALVAMSVAALSAPACGSSSHTSGSPATAVALCDAAGVIRRRPVLDDERCDFDIGRASTHAIDVCAALPAASAAKLSGQAVTTAHAQTGLQPQEYGCAYSNDDDSVQMEVKVFEHDAATSYDLFFSGSQEGEPGERLG